jgi:hypothetical protein
LTKKYQKEIESLSWLLKKRLNPTGNNVLKDIKLSKNYLEINDNKQKNLLLGLLYGRSVDSFTKVYLYNKNQSINGTLEERIDRIININQTQDKFTLQDLHEVRKLRNDLFHDANTHYENNKIERYVLFSLICMTKLCNEIR